MGKSNTTLAAAAATLADGLGIKPSRTVRRVRDLAASVRDCAPRKGSEGRRPEPAAPGIPEVTRRVTPTPSWVYVDTTSRWGVVMESEGCVFVTSAEPGEDGQIDLTTLPLGKVIGVCGYWRYHDIRFPSVNWRLASYGQLSPWQVPLAVSTHSLSGVDRLWYEEKYACSVSF